MKFIENGKRSLSRIKTLIKHVFLLSYLRELYINEFLKYAFMYILFSVDGCQVEVEKVGCFADKTRPFKELLINRRNTLGRRRVKRLSPTVKHFLS